MSKKLRKVSLLLVTFGIGVCACACSDSNTQQATPDANVEIDGVLNEAFWENQKWLTSSYSGSSAENIAVRSTAYFGENGLYIGVTVEDETAYNADKDLLQIYFASEDYSSAADGLYRIGFTAGGSATLTEYTDSGNFDGVTPDAASAPQTVMQRQSDGKCYNAEIFLPYALFGGEIDGIWYNAAVAADSEEWHNFAETEIGGDTLVPNTWWKMTEKGLLAYSISIEAGAGGSVSANKDYLLPDEKVVFTINVDDGYYIKGLTLNGINVFENIKNQNGVITYTSPAMNRDIVLKAEFEQTFTVNGTIKYDNSLSTQMNADIAVVLSNGKISVPVSLNQETGEFTANVLAGEYRLILTSKSEAYEVWSETVNVDGNKTVDVNVDQYSWGENRIISLGDNTVSVRRNGGEGESIIYSGQLSTNKYAFSAFFNVGGGSYTDSATNVTGLYFRTTNGNVYLNIQLLNWNNGGLVLKDVKNQTGDVKLSVDSKALEKLNDGIYITIFVDGDTVSFWTDDGNGAFTKIKEYTVEGLGDARLTQVAQYGEDGISETNPFNLKEARIACNADTMAKIYPRIEMKAEYDSGKVTVSGLQENYAYGETVTFTAEPKEGYVLRIEYNGAELTVAAGNTYTFTASAMSKIKVIAYDADMKVSGTIKLNNALDLSGLTLTLTGGGEPITATVQTGNTVTLSNVALGTYTAYLTVNGLQVPVGQLVVTGETLSEELTVSSLSGANAAIDVANGSVSYTSDGGTADRALYTISDLSITDTIYLRTKLTLAANTVSGDNGPGFVITVGGKSFNVRFLNNTNKTINVWYGGTWKSVTLSDWTVLQSGAVIILELNPKNGDFAMYIETKSGVVKLPASASNMTGISNATITKVVVNAWHPDNFSMTEIEFIESLPAYYKGVTVQAAYEADQVDFSGADGTYAYGDTISFTATAKEGYTITAVTYNGTALESSGNGQYSVTFTGIAAKIVVTSSVADLTVSGTIKYNGAVSAEMNEDLTVALTNEESNVSGTLNDQGEFTVSVPAGEYRLVFTSKSGGYEVFSQTVNVNENKTVDVNVDQYSWGENRIISLGDHTVSVTRGSGEGESIIYSGKLETNKFAFSAFFNVGGGSYTDSVTNVTGLYFRFDNSSLYLNFQVLNWNNGGLVLKDSKNSTGDVKPSAESKALEKLNKGLYITIFVDGDTVSFWTDNGNGSFTKLKEYTVTGLGNARLTQVAQYGDTGISETNPFNLKEARIVCNADAMAKVYPRIEMKAEYDSGKVTVSGLQESYAYGDTVTFTAEPIDGYALRVEYNGKELTAAAGNAYTFAASAMSKITITAHEADVKASGTVTLKNSLDLSGLTLTLTGGDEPITATVQTGNTVTLSNVALGTYTAYLTVSGVQVPVGQLAVTGATLSEELTVSSLNGANATIDVANGNVSYTSDGGTADRALYTISDLSITDTIYLRTKLTLAANTVSGDNGPGFVITVGGKSFNVRFLNNTNKTINVWYGGTWKSVTLSDWTVLQSGAVIILELNPKNGDFAMYMETKSGVVKLPASASNMTGISNATITKVVVNAWHPDNFSMTEIEFIESLPTT